jgi:tryptophan-rich sensory protein
MWSAWVQIVIFVVVALLANALWYFVGVYKSSKGVWCKGSLIPPGYIIGIVWTVIFGALGYAHYLTYREGNDGEGGFTVASIAILVVALFCLLYGVAVYYLPEYIKLLNVTSLVLAFTLGILVINESEAAFWYVLPLIVWSAYVNMAESLVVCKSNIKALASM